MRSMIKDPDVFLSRAAFWLLVLGMLLLIVEVVSSAYARFTSGGPFAASSHFSGTAGYRIIAIVAFVAACGLIYSLGKLGRVMAFFLGAIALWEVVMWYSVYQGVAGGPTFEALVMLSVGVLSVIFLLGYAPYTLLKGLGSINHPAR